MNGISLKSNSSFPFLHFCSLLGCVPSGGLVLKFALGLTQCGNFMNNNNNNGAHHSMSVVNDVVPNCSLVFVYWSCTFPWKAISHLHLMDGGTNLSMVNIVCPLVCILVSGSTCTLTLRVGNYITAFKELHEELHELHEVKRQNTEATGRRNCLAGGYQISGPEPQEGTQEL